MKIFHPLFPLYALLFLLNPFFFFFSVRSISKSPRRNSRGGERFRACVEGGGGDPSISSFPSLLPYFQERKEENEEEEDRKERKSRELSSSFGRRKKIGIRGPSSPSISSHGIWSTLAVGEKKSWKEGEEFEFNFISRPLCWNLRVGGKKLPYRREFCVLPLLWVYTVCTFEMLKPPPQAKPAKASSIRLKYFPLFPSY